MNKTESIMYQLISLLRNVAASTITARKYHVSVDERWVHNHIADTITNQEGIIYLEEFRQGSISTTRYGMCREVSYTITFARIVPTDYTAEEKVTVRDEIYEEAVKPVIDAILALYNEEVSNFTFVERGGRWDANETQISLRFKIKEEWTRC